ncbi:MAG: transposase family protein [Anaerolineae bacterium]|nr:transposase family protein [Anaerolineae bacterium]
MMTTDDKMTIDEAYKYLRKMRPAYEQANQTEKGRMLDDMERVTGRHRKSLIRLLHSPLERHPRQRQRGRTYQAEFDDALRRIYESYGRVCAERLHPNLVDLATQLAAHGEIDLTESLQAQLATVGLTTVRERLRQFRQDEPQRPRRTPRTPNPFLQDIPMRRLPWDISTPGYFEVDLVHHCGPSSHGEYVHTLQMIDVASGWSERVALLGRSYRVMEDGFRRILARLPFPILGLHPDNGSEFFNNHMARFWAAYPQIEISRSRPYQKNDNRFVEQKNSSLVRDYVGDIRLDTVAQTQALERLYQQLWLFNNCFQPTLRLSRKEILPDTDDHPGRIRRRYAALTPWRRICEADVLEPEQHAMPQLRSDVTNPRTLHQQIQDQLAVLFQLPTKSSEDPEDVFKTLSES